MNDKSFICQFYVILGDEHFQVPNDGNRYINASRVVDIPLIREAVLNEFRKVPKGMRVAENIIFLIPDESYLKRAREIIEVSGFKGNVMRIPPRRSESVLNGSYLQQRQNMPYGREREVSVNGGSGNSVGSNVGISGNRLEETSNLNILSSSNGGLSSNLSNPGFSNGSVSRDSNSLGNSSFGSGALGNNPLGRSLGEQGSVGYVSSSRESQMDSRGSVNSFNTSYYGNKETASSFNDSSVLESGKGSVSSLDNTSNFSNMVNLGNTSSLTPVVDGNVLNTSNYVSGGMSQSTSSVGGLNNEDRNMRSVSGNDDDSLKWKFTNDIENKSNVSGGDISNTATFSNRLDVDGRNGNSMQVAGNTRVTDNVFRGDIVRSEDNYSRRVDSGSAMSNGYGSLRYDDERDKLRNFSKKESGKSSGFAHLPVIIFVLSFLLLVGSILLLVMVE